jgi:thiamine kinase-like enzyme
MSVAASLRASIGQIAPDHALPQMPRLLDAGAMAPVLGRSLPPDAELTDVRIRQVSYEPNKSLLVQFDLIVGNDSHEAVVLADVDTDLAAWAVAPEHVALAGKVNGRTPARTPLAYDVELDALIQWVPLDLALPAFAEAPERLRELIEEAGVETVPADELPQRIGYKPRRRAVFRLGRHFVKMYGKESLFARSVHNLRAAASLSLRTPRCEAAIPGLRIEVQSLLEGRRPAGPAEAARDAGALLPVLHTAQLDGLRSAPPGYWLRNACGSARVLAAIAPRLEPRLEALLHELELRAEDAVLVPCHVDFFARQLVELDGQYGLVDFDRMSMAAPALDLATYASELVRRPADLPRAAAVLDVLCGAYGSRPPGISWYLTVVLLRRALNPFLHFVDGWPDQVEQRVSAAEAALEQRVLLGEARSESLRRDVAVRRDRPQLPVTRTSHALDQIPRDSALPQMPLLLDVNAMAPVLERSLGRNGSISAIRIGYVRYRPARILSVRYEVAIRHAIHDVVAVADAKADLAGRATKAEHLALAKKVEGRTPAERPLDHDPELDILVQWAPLDLALPAMAEPPAQLLALIEEAGVEARAAGELPTLVNFKPGQRGVLRFGDHFIKIYAEEKYFKRAVVGLQSATSLPYRTPRCEAIVPEFLLTVQSFVAGTRPRDPSEVAPDAGAFLGLLHAARFDGLVQAPPARRLKAAATSARLLAAIAPHLERRLQSLLRKLELEIPQDALIPCHGDFDARQMLALEDGFAVVDFDSMCCAHPALDLASYISALVTETNGLPHASATLDVLTDAYGRRPTGVAWYLCVVLLRKALIPFRDFKDDWPEEVERRVAAAEAAIAL